MLINRHKVKNLIREHAKQVSSEYLNALDRKVRDIILSSIMKSRRFKRLKSSELI